MKNVDSPATRKVRPVKTGEKSRVHAFRIKSSWWCELRPNWILQYYGRCFDNWLEAVHVSCVSHGMGSFGAFGAGCLIGNKYWVKLSIHYYKTLRCTSAQIWVSRFQLIHNITKNDFLIIVVGHGTSYSTHLRQTHVLHLDNKKHHRRKNRRYFTFMLRLQVLSLRLH